MASSVGFVYKTTKNKVIPTCPKLYGQFVNAKDKSQAFK